MAINVFIFTKKHFWREKFSNIQLMLQQRIFVTITCFEKENDQYAKRTLREPYPGRDATIKVNKYWRVGIKSERRLTVRTPERVTGKKMHSCRRNILRIAKTTLSKITKKLPRKWLSWSHSEPYFTSVNWNIFEINVI